MGSPGRDTEVGCYALLHNLHRDLPDPGIEPTSFMSPALAGRFFTTTVTWEAPSKSQIPQRQKVPQRHVSAVHLEHQVCQTNQLQQVGNSNPNLVK